MNDMNQEDRASLFELAPVMVRDGRKRVLMLATVFCLVAVAALVVGLSWPKKYYADTTILVSEDNIIRQLMEGRAVATGVYDRAGIAREVMFSRRAMLDIMELGGWLDDNPSAAEQGRRAELIQSRTLIGSPRENLISIQYWDTDPERAYKVTQRFADLFMSESLEAKLREGREAHDFIAEQVQQYQAKLVAAEQSLKDFRDSNVDARPGSATDVSVRIGELRRQIEAGRMELMDLRSRESALTGQLGQESATFGVANRQSQFHLRIAELQQELDRLLLDYTDAHPDVSRVRHQIADMRSGLAGDGGERFARAEPDLIQANPLHMEMRTQLADHRRAIAGLTSRLQASEALLAEELQRDHRVAATESDLAELNRDYEVNRDIYQDLLRRREHAQLSMSLDEGGRGLSFRIHEPAAVPSRPSGVRFAHFAAGGLLAAAAMPFGLLFLLVRFDPRIRSPSDVERQTGLPVVVSVPTYHNESDRSHWSTQAGAAAALVAITLAAYAAAGWLRLVEAS
jgi:polysaccharide chain length determinant protein (PEP-CTERM system associated)